MSARMRITFWLQWQLSCLQPLQDQSSPCTKDPSVQFSPRSHHSHLTLTPELPCLGDLPQWKPWQSRSAKHRFQRWNSTWLPAATRQRCKQQCMVHSVTGSTPTAPPAQAETGSRAPKAAPDCPVECFNWQPQTSLLIMWLENNPAACFTPCRHSTGPCWLN